MKTEIDRESDRQVVAYPYLGCLDDMVVLFTEKGVGVLVHGENNSQEEGRLGMESRHWDEGLFSFYPGKVILSN